MLPWLPEGVRHRLVDETINGQNLLAQLHSVALGYTLSVGRN